MRSQNCWGSTGRINVVASTTAAAVLNLCGERQNQIAPTTPAELQAVVRGGELLPQKSTHFYPKLLDGLVFSRVGDEA